MKDLIDKISSYNIFNYLFPGVVFAAMATRLSSYNLLIDDLVVGVFVYYLYGMVISRIGSIIIEPLLRRLKVIRYADYKELVAASQADVKIDILIEQSNTYRTLAAMFLCVLPVIAADVSRGAVPGVSDYGLFLGLLLLAWLFLCSFVKQTGYITDRVAAVNQGAATR